MIGEQIDLMGALEASIHRARAARQRDTDNQTRPARVEAVTRDLLADLEYHDKEKRHGRD